MTRFRQLPSPLSVAIFAATVAFACGGSSTPPAPAEGQAPPVAPISSRSGADPGPATAATAAAGLAWDLPAGWQAVAPSSSMRLAEASIPGPGGAGELVVFYFGPGQGGGVEDNLQRWVGQMEMAPGSSPQRDSFAAGGYQVTWLEVAGTLLPSGMGSGPSQPVPGSRMLAAVVEGPGGPWFFKATGPDATMTAARAGFRSLLESVRAGS